MVIWDNLLQLEILEALRVERRFGVRSFDFRGCRASKVDVTTDTCDTCAEEVECRVVGFLLRGRLCGETTVSRTLCMFPNNFFDISVISTTKFRRNARALLSAMGWQGE